MHSSTVEIYYSKTTVIDGVSLPLIKIAHNNKKAATKWIISLQLFLISATMIYTYDCSEPSALNVYSVPSIYTVLFWYITPFVGSK